MYNAGSLRLDGREWKRENFDINADIDFLIEQEDEKDTMGDVKTLAKPTVLTDKGTFVPAYERTELKHPWRMSQLKMGHAYARADLLLNEEEAYLNDKRQREPPKAFEVATRDPRTGNHSQGQERMELLYKLLDSFSKKRTPDQKRVHEEVIRCAAPHIYGEDYNSARLGLLEKWKCNTPHMAVMMLTPRRWGKTTSVSMIAAALLYVCPYIKITIFSTTQHMASMLLDDIRSALMELPGIKERMKSGDTTDNKKEISLVGYGYKIGDRGAPRSAVRARMGTVHGTLFGCTHIRTQGTHMHNTRPIGGWRKGARALKEGGRRTATTRGQEPKVPTHPACLFCAFYRTK